jgi:hypothetical protein
MGAGGLLMDVAKLFGGLFYAGGEVKSYATGGIAGKIASAANKERAMTGKNPVIAMLSEGERVLNHQETKIWNRLQKSNVPNFAKGGEIGMQVSSAIASPAQAGANFLFNIPINVQGDGWQIDEPRLVQAIQNVAHKEIINQMRQGGAVRRGNPYGR